MSDDTEIDEWLGNIVQGKTQTVEPDVDTLFQARELLQSWAQDTESFQPPQPSPTKAKVARYRKLDMPMLVAKKKENIVCVDHNAQMEARLLHVKEMKAERMKRQAAQPLQPPSPPKLRQEKINIPNIDDEIRRHRSEVNTRVDRKQKELVQRQRKSQKLNQIADLAVESVMRKRAENTDAKYIERKYDYESLNMQLQLYHKNYIIRQERRFFHHWTNKCQFHTQAYEKAEVLCNFKIQSSFFSLWKIRQKQSKQKRELREIETRIIHEKRLEEISRSMYYRNTLHKYINLWITKFKAHVEYRKAQAEIQKRRELLTQSPKNTPRTPKQPQSPSQESPPPKGSRPLKIPKIEITKLKTDPKIEAMAKRMEENKNARIEKLRKKAEEEKQLKEEKKKLEEEEAKRKRIEHLNYLKLQKEQRELDAQNKLEMERQIERMKWCKSSAIRFRKRHLCFFHLEQWKKVLSMEHNYEIMANRQYENHLEKVAFKSIKIFNLSQKSEKELIAIKHYKEILSRTFLILWYNQHLGTLSLEHGIRNMCMRWKLRRGFDMLISEKKRRRKEAIKAAEVHAQFTLMKKTWNAWPIGCAAAKDEDEREKYRDNLYSKALKLLDDLSSDSL